LNVVVLVSSAGKVALGERGEDGDEWFWCEVGGGITDEFYDSDGISEVTHWMPLPPGPAEEEK
jgi:hypothetical protein